MLMKIVEYTVLIIVVRILIKVEFWIIYVLNPHRIQSNFPKSLGDCRLVFSSSFLCHCEVNNVQMEVNDVVIQCSSTYCT